MAQLKERRTRTSTERVAVHFVVVEFSKDSRNVVGSMSRQPELVRVRGSGRWASRAGRTAQQSRGDGVRLPWTSAEQSMTRVASVASNGPKKGEVEHHLSPA